jgi:predicted Zn-dependent peptidase
MLVKVGSRHDPETIAGTAHFLEHMFFKGTEEFPTSGKLAMEIEMLGGVTNAFTSYEYTGYYIKVPKKSYKRAIQILAQVMVTPVFKEEELQKEKGVISEEIKMYNDLPHEIVKDVFNSTLFPNHPLGEDIAGTVETVNIITIAAINDFRNNYYVSENMLLMVSGDVDEDSVENITNDAFRGLRKAPVAGTINLFKGREIVQKFKHISKNSEQAHVVIGGLSHQRNHEHEFPLKLGMYILTEGFGSILFQKLREDLGIAYYVGGGIGTFTDVGKYVVNAGLAMDKVELGVKAILEGLASIGDGIFSDMDLIRAKNYYIASITEEVETAEDKASWYGMNLLFDRKHLHASEVIDEIEGIERELLIEAWKGIIYKDNMLVTVLSKSFNQGIIESVNI